MEKNAFQMNSICIIAYTDYLTDARVMRHAESAFHAGYAVDVITPIRRGQEEKLLLNGVTIHRLRVTNYQGSRRYFYILAYLNFFFRCFVRVSRLHIKNCYRIIQVCNMPDFLVFSTVLPKLWGARIILDIHDPMPHTYLAKFPGSSKNWFYRLIMLMERLSAAFSDKVMTVSEPVKRDILIEDGIPAEKITVVTNFADEQIFKLHEDYGITLPLRLLYYGTISARFGFSDVLSAIHKIQHKDQISLKIIGKGDGAAMLQERIQLLGLENVATFDNRTYPLRLMPDIIGKHHLGLVPYSPSHATDYMLPVKLLELLAMGIPAITIPNTAIRHYFDESLYFTYNPRNIETLTLLIERLLDDPTQILIKREAVLKARSRFIWKNERQKYLGALSQLSL